jgi:hypothetical protein
VSRRWYRHAAQVIFVGWEPADQAFYLNVVDLCAACGGTGEIAGSEEVCPGCGGEGVQVAKLNPSHRQGGLSLDDIGSRLASAGVPFPDYVRSDLAADQRANAGVLLHEYDLQGD